MRGDHNATWIDWTPIHHWGDQAREPYRFPRFFCVTSGRAWPERVPVRQRLRIQGRRNLVMIDPGARWTCWH